MAKYSRFDPRNKKKNRHKNEHIPKPKPTDRRSNDDTFQEEQIKEYRIKYN